MTALAVPTVHDVPAGTSVRPLALIEAKRFARHPLFLVGAVMCAIFSSATTVRRSWTTTSSRRSSSACSAWSSRPG